MNWYNEFNGTFWITIATLLTGSLALCVRYCLKSKCDRVNICCGMISIHRDVELELSDIETDQGINNENNI
jgi:hypothetical protein